MLKSPYGGLKKAAGRGGDCLPKAKLTEMSEFSGNGRLTFVTDRILVVSSVWSSFTPILKPSTQTFMLFYEIIRVVAKLAWIGQNLLVLTFIKLCCI